MDCITFWVCAAAPYSQQLGQNHPDTTNQSYLITLMSHSHTWWCVFLTIRGGQRTLTLPILCISSIDRWTAKLENALWSMKPAVVTSVFTEQFMGSPKSHLLRNEKEDPSKCSVLGSSPPFGSFKSSCWLLFLPHFCKQNFSLFWVSPIPRIFSLASSWP